MRGRARLRVRIQGGPQRTQPPGERDLAGDLRVDVTRTVQRCRKPLGVVRGR